MDAVKISVENPCIHHKHAQYISWLISKTGVYFIVALVSACLFLPFCGQTLQIQITSLDDISMFILSHYIHISNEIATKEITKINLTNKAI